MIFEALHGVTPLLQLVSQCFVRSAKTNTPSTLTKGTSCNKADLDALTQVARKFA